MTIMEDIEVVERRMRELSEELGKLGADEVDVDAVELRVLEMAKAWGRAQMARAMKRADAQAPEMDIDGKRWGNRRVTPHDYETVFGTVSLERAVYQQSGRGRVAVPLDLRLGMVEGTYTPRLARIATKALANMPEQEAADMLGEVGVATLSNSTIGRLGRAMAARYEQRRPIIASAIREQHPIPAEAVTVQVGLDGVMVPQDGEHAQPRGRKSDDPEPPRHETRYGVVCDPGPAASDGTAGRAWHEGGVGTLAFYDVDGERLDTIYLARMPEPHKKTLVEELEAELHTVLREQPAMNIVLASDGADPQWQALDAIESRLPPESSGHRMKLVDAFHVAEYVQKAANAIWGIGEPEAHVQAAAWRETIKVKASGADEVLRSMRARLSAPRNATGRKELREAIDYIARQNALGRMKYVEAQRRGYPIGTGVTEAAAKTVVGSRMKRAGARFSQHGGQTVMLFRTATLSRRFEALHRELGATYAATVKEAA
jgi:hypothetical protein